MAPKAPLKAGSAGVKTASSNCDNVLFKKLLQCWNGCNRKKMCNDCFTPGDSLDRQNACVLALFDDNCQSLGVTLVGPKELVLGKTSTCSVRHGTMQVRALSSRSRNGLWNSSSSCTVLQQAPNQMYAYITIPTDEGIMGSMKVLKAGANRTRVGPGSSFHALVQGFGFCGCNLLQVLKERWFFYPQPSLTSLSIDEQSSTDASGDTPVLMKEKKRIVDEFMNSKLIVEEKMVSTQRLHVNHALARRCKRLS